MASSDLNGLRNLGALQVGDPVPPGEKTIVVLGVARGGTSMVASVLRQLGIFLGDKAVPPVFEDVRLATAIESGSTSEAKAIVREYDAAHAVWGFKRPAVIERLDAVAHLLRNPVYVVVFRDVLSIANRNALSMKSDPLRSMRQALRQYGILRDFLETANPTALLISNEKALLRPDAFVEQLVSWLGLEPTEEQRRRATAAIVVDHPQYLDAARLHFLGHLDKATVDYVSGWAFVRGQNTPAKLEVLVNGQSVGTVVADRQRPDVLKRGVHPTGFCGFRHAFRDGAVSPGDEVTVRFVVGGQPLHGAPRRVE